MAPSNVSGASGRVGVHGIIVVDAVMTPGYIWEQVFWSFVPAGGPANQSSEDRDGSYLGGVLQEAHAVSESTAYEAVSCASSICVLETSYRNR